MSVMLLEKTELKMLFAWCEHICFTFIHNIFLTPRRALYILILAHLTCHVKNIVFSFIHLTGEVGRVLDFQSIGPGSIPGGARNFNLYPRTVCVCVCVLCMGGTPDDVSEEPVTLAKRKKGWRMSCDVGEVTKMLENEQFTYVTWQAAHLYLISFRKLSRGLDKFIINVYNI